MQKIVNAKTKRARNLEEKETEITALRETIFRMKTKHSKKESGLQKEKQMLLENLNAERERGKNDSIPAQDVAFSYQREKVVVFLN